MSALFDLEKEYHKVTEQWRLTHTTNAAPQTEAESRTPEKHAAVVGPKSEDAAPTYWDEKKKDRREEFKREDAENHERAYPEWKP